MLETLSIEPRISLIPCLLLIAVGLVMRYVVPQNKSLAQYFNKKTETNTLTAREALNFNAIKPIRGLPDNVEPDWPRYWKPGKFQMTMALRKMDINNWLNYDKLFDSEHAAKVAMVRGPNPELYVDYLDGIDDAVLELLETIVDYVTTRFPDMFRADAEYVYIDHLNEKYRIREPFELHPLAVVGLLVHDDVYVLKKGLRDLYYMRGVFLGCPSGWRVQQRIGWPLHQIHDDVPMWKEKLQRSMERFFLNLRPDKAIQRNNLFIQPVGGIFHVVPFDRQPKCTSYEQVHIRTELQSLQRLPRSQANIFTVRTYLTPLTELRKEPEQLEALWDHVRSFPKDIAEYKCHHLWGDVSEEFCREVLGKNDPCIQADGAGGGVKEERLSEKTCPAGF